MQLRPYQIDLVNRVGAALSEHRSVLLQLPTGGGKTHIAAHVAGVSAAVGERVWMIAHRREIIGQTSRSMAALGVPHGVVGAGRPFVLERPVQVCAIGSLGRRADALPLPDLMIWDEAHHVAAKSWAALRARFPDARHLGLTATPERLDGKGLGEFFAELICGPSTAELMAAGHLSPYRLFAPTIPDLRGVGVRGGDWARDQLAERMSGATLVGDAVEHYRRHADGARAIAFCVTVEASRTLAARFNAAGIPAAHVGGDTPGEERDAAIADLEAGHLRVLTNVEVFTEGFDLPAIDAVILLRPTQSLALHRQMVGRGLRTAPGKGATVILDHAGLFYDHGLPDETVEWSLDRPMRRRRMLGAEQLRRCPECSAVHAMAASCPECGHLYAAVDRTIQEICGELREVGVRSGAMPEGFETLGAFARRVGKKRNALERLPAKGFPISDGGMVPIADALTWLKSNPIRPYHRSPPADMPDGSCEPQTLFAQRVGFAPGWVHRLTRRGLPVASNGWVHIERALVWLKQNHKRSSGFGNARAPAGYESQTAFAHRIGLSSTARRILIRRGLPVADNGLVHIETGLAWIAKHGARIQKPEK